MHSPNAGFHRLKPQPRIAEHAEEELQGDATGCILVVLSGGSVPVDLKVHLESRVEGPGSRV